MATLAEALKDKKGFPDDTKFTSGNGFETTLGELRAFQEATGQDVAKQLEAERTKLAGEQAAIAKAQEEVVALWTKLQEQAGKQPVRTEPTGSDWTKDPFFAPIAEHLDKNVMAVIKQQAEQIQQFQKALGLGVKYITDTFSEIRYSQLPEEFRKEVSYTDAVKTASEKKFLDSGGIPDIRKVHEEWDAPRSRKAELDKLRAEIQTEERQKAMQATLPRPGGMPTGTTGAPDPNAPKNVRESFQRLKEDPAFIEMVYGMGSGQA